MPKFYDSIEPQLEKWALQQPVFFTASAPLTGRHINVSPKGLPAASFSILNPNLCCYVDATGSGSETISHIFENGRVTIMFCSFGPSPRIMRFFCTGKVVEYTQPEFDSWLKKMGDKKVVGARAVILLDVFKVQTSCGYGVPYLSMRPDLQDESKKIPYLADRETLGHWAGTKVEKGEIAEYQRQNNRGSLDGLPGLRSARRDMGENLWYGDMKATLKKKRAILHPAVVALISAIVTIMIMFLLGLTDDEAFDQLLFKR